MTSLTVQEAIAITQSVARGLQRSGRPVGDLLVPSAGDIRLGNGGEISWRHGVSTSADAAGHQLGRLLSRLVDAAEQRGHRAGPHVKLAIDRAVGEQSAAPIASLSEFSAVIERLGLPEPRDLVAAVARRAAARSEDLPRERLVTIADLRRARRSRGASLGSIAAETGLSESLLRQLEWGMLENWPAGTYGQQSARAYAQAAGLEPSAVLAVLTAEIAQKEALPAALAPAPMRALARTTLPPSRRGRKLALRIAAAAAIAAGVGAAMWQSRGSAVPSPQPAPIATAESAPRAVPAAVIGEAAPPVPEPAPAPAPAPGPSDDSRGERALQPQTSGEAHRRAPGGGIDRDAPGPQRARPSPGEDRRQKAKPSFWNRPILIIKFGDPAPDVSDRDPSAFS